MFSFAGTVSENACEIPEPGAEARSEYAFLAPRGRVASKMP
jgi:hypothetical protein